jgi:hypothetical protein
MNRILTYDNQLEFKKFAKLGAKCKFYFDNTSCVDDKTSANIPNVCCDGTLTFGKAKKILVKYFNDKAKAEAKEKKRLAKEKAKAKKVAKKAKAEAKKLKAKEKAKAKREAAKIKAQAKKEKVAIKKAKLKEKKRLAKEKAKALETAKKVKINKKQNASTIVAELDTVEADVKTTAKLIKNTMTTIAAELVKLNIEDRGKRIKMLEKLGYQIREDNNELIVSFIDTKSKKLKAHKSDNVKKVAIRETDHPNKNENVDVFASTPVESIKPTEDNKVIDDTIESELNDIPNETEELDNEDLNDEIVPPQIEVEDDEIEDDDLVDEYNEDDDRYDREMDDDKVDFRRDYFNDFGDDGEVNDDY